MERRPNVRIIANVCQGARAPKGVSACEDNISSLLIYANGSDGPQIVVTFPQSIPAGCDIDPPFSLVTGGKSKTKSIRMKQLTKSLLAGRHPSLYHMLEDC